MDKRHFIACNAATLFQDGEVVNLGIGIPTLASNYIDSNITVFIHAENGAIGIADTMGKPWDNSSRESVVAWLCEHGGDDVDWRTGHRDLCNAGNDVVTLVPGASCFDTLMAFSIARGGHLDATVLGALQVDAECNLANWKIPGKKLNGMGGAMDIVSGAKRVIIAMEHCNKANEPKIVQHCSLPLTASHCVTDIVTDLCIIKCQPGKFVVTAIAQGITQNELQQKTGVPLQFAKDLKLMALCQ